MTSKAYQNMRKATLKDARALKVGNVVEAAYQDSERTQLLIVMNGTATAKEGEHHNVQVMLIHNLGMRHITGPTLLVTDRWRLVGNLHFVNSAESATLVAQDIQQAESKADAKAKRIATRN